MTSPAFPRGAIAIFKETYRIVRDHGLILFLAYGLPLWPCYAAMLHANQAKDKGLYFGMVLLSFVLAYCVTGPLVHMTAQAAAGGSVDASAAFRRVMRGRQPSYAGAFFLALVIILIGFMLFILPGVVAGVALMFAIPAVVLERIEAGTALNRSLALGKGRYLANFGTILLQVPVIVGLLFAAAFLAGALRSPAWLALTIIAGVQAFGGMLIQMTVTLLYLDARARTEDYDRARLQADLTGGSDTLATDRAV